MVAPVLASVLALALSSCAPKPQVTKVGPVEVDVHPINLAVRYVDHVYFPQGKGCGRAYTFWSYDCKTKFGIKPRPDLSKPDSSVFEITAVKMDISLDVVEQLPFFVSDKLRKHEEGHVEMCRRLYSNAGPIATACAQKMVGMTVSVKPSDLSRPSSLLASADHEAHLSLCKAYRAQTSDIADEVAITFDRLTSHGMNNVPEAQASKESFLKYFADGKPIPAGDEDLAH